MASLRDMLDAELLEVEPAITGVTKADYVSCTAFLRSLHPSPQPYRRRVNKLDIVRELGLVTGGSIIAKLDASQDTLVTLMRGFLDGEGLDVGDAQTRTAIDGLTDDGDPTKLTTAEAAALKGLGERLLPRWRLADDAPAPGRLTGDRLTETHVLAVLDEV